MTWLVRVECRGVAGVREEAAGGRARGLRDAATGRGDGPVGSEPVTNLSQGAADLSSGRCAAVRSRFVLRAAPRASSSPGGPGQELAGQPTVATTSISKP